MRKLAVERQLEIIGQAANELPRCLLERGIDEILKTVY
jgi:uncharacterized protein with HEPN domain